MGKLSFKLKTLRRIAFNKAQKRDAQGRWTKTGTTKYFAPNNKADIRQKVVAAFVKKRTELERKLKRPLNEQELKKLSLVATKVFQEQSQKVSTQTGHKNLIASGQELISPQLATILAGTSNLPSPKVKELETQLDTANKAYKKLDYKLYDDDTNDSMKEKIYPQLEKLQAQVHQLTSDIHAEKLRIFKYPETAMEELKSSLIKQSGVSREDALKWANSIKIADHVSRYQNVPQLKDNLIEFCQLTGNKIGDSLKSIECISKRPSITINGILNIGHSENKSSTKNAAWHECGHALEFEDKEVKDAAISWLESRASGPIKKLSELIVNSDYKDELAIPDNFVNPYVGRVYPDKSTEVVSMGLERFTTGADMLEFYKKDPEHFMFTLGVIRKKAKGKGQEAEG